MKMEKGCNIKDKLEKIREQQAFEQLTEYTDPTCWEALNSEERELLGLLFVQRGETELDSEKPLFNSFDLAAQIAPLSYEVFYRQGVAYATREDSDWFLQAAARSFEKAISLADHRFDPWFAWGCVLCKLGILNSNMTLLFEAHDKFIHAEGCLKPATGSKAANLYHVWGIIWYHLGLCSGEAYEIRRAITYLQKARVRGCNRVEFWCDIGNALSALSFLVNRLEGLVAGIDAYWKAIKQDPKSIEGWRGAAINFYHLYLAKGFDEDFTFAHHCFEETVALDLQDFSCCLKWGHLLVQYGNKRKEPDWILEGIEKYKAANLSLPNQFSLHYHWAEALISYASLVETFPELKEAQRLIALCLEEEPEHVPCWFLAARCEQELGHYFGSADYYQKSIDHFNKGLTLDPKDGFGWYGKAISFFSLVEYTNESSFLVNALSCYERAESLGVIASHFFCDWGIALTKLGEQMGTARFVEEALVRFETALQIMIARSEPADIDILYHYGFAADLLMEMTGEVEFAEKAVQLLEKAIELDPLCFPVHLSFALALAHLGEGANDIDCFQRSFAHFQLCTEIDPENGESWMEWGIALISFAYLLETAEINMSHQFYREAEKQLLTAAALGERYAYYPLAELHSLLGQFDASIGYLKKSFIENTLPELEEIENDTWMKKLLTSEQYQQWLHKQEPSYE